MIIISLFSINHFVHLGERTAATPDGRNKGMPFGNSIGPVPGRDKEGLTAMLSSVSKLPLDLGVGGTTCNVTIPGDHMKTPEMRKKIEALMKAFGTGARRDYKERYIVRFNDRLVPLETSNIAYIYSEEKNNYLVTFDEQRYIIDSSLDLVIDEFNPEQFFRVSRSCIVSLKAIVSIIKQAGGRLRIVARPEPDFEMTVSRSRVDDFLKWLER